MGRGVGGRARRKGCGGRVAGRLCYMLADTGWVLGEMDTY